jgi:hypothetical protein
MVAELENWRAAVLVINRYGAAAETEADNRAEMLLERGDREGVDANRAGPLMREIDIAPQKP